MEIVHRIGYRPLNLMNKFLGILSRRAIKRKLGESARHKIQDNIWNSPENAPVITPDKVDVKFAIMGNFDIKFID